MQAILLIDFGSTFTKVVAVDVSLGCLLGTGVSFTTVETDVADGLDLALGMLYEKIGEIHFTKRLACSSAAGGLKMAVSGLVPNLTAKAAKMASLGAGARLCKVFSYRMTDDDIFEISMLKPDIFLLAGGTDGGNKEVIIHNAQMLSDCEYTDFPILIAGNREATADCESILKDFETYRCDNVLPELSRLNTESVGMKIREIFLKQIIKAKGLSQASDLLDEIIMPTPAAMLEAMKLLAKGTKSSSGLGELLAIDLGGATTDAYSIHDGLPKRDRVTLRGIEEPFAKRSVEGDIGMRYTAGGVLEAVGAEKLSQISNIEPEQLVNMINMLEQNPEKLPGTSEEKALDYALASMAVQTAALRHAGTIEEVYAPTGPAYVQVGKDLTDVKSLVITGGAAIHNENVDKIAKHALQNGDFPESLLPSSADVYVDRKYILSAMGLLSTDFSDVALNIMKKELVRYGAGE